LRNTGVEPIVLPPRSPNLNAYCERFVRSIQEEVLKQMVMLGEGSLTRAIYQYLAHYHTERNHQDLDNHLIMQEGKVSGHMGQVVRRERLGGLLSYYHRAAA
jgi:putative transposase